MEQVCLDCGTGLFRLWNRVLRGCGLGLFRDCVKGLFGSWKRVVRGLWNRVV